MRYLNWLLALASASFFYASVALAQNAGSVTNHAFAIGKGAGAAGYTSLLCGSAQLAVGQAAADPICQTITGDVTLSAGGATAIGANKVLNSMLATVSANTVKGATAAGNASDLSLPSCSTGSSALTYATGSGFGCNTFASTGANPSASIGLSAVNGVATTYMRSDAAPALSQSIIPTWTGTHTFSNSTYSALFNGGPIGINNATPTAPLHVGGVAAASSGSNILSARNSTGTTSVHGFAENSTINLSANGQGMDSYDARMVVSGTATYDHFVSYQSRPQYGSSGVSTWGYDFWGQAGITGPVTNFAGHYAAAPSVSGGGSIANLYAFYAEAMTSGATLNYAFYSAGTTPSKFGGNVDVGGLSLAGSDQFGAWTAYTPSVSAQTNGGTMTTSASGRYKQIGKTVCVSIQASTSALGTATGYLILGLPVAAKQTTGPGIAFSGLKSGSISLNAIIDTTITIDVVKYDGTSPLTAGNAYYITGCYEAA